jgi:catechol 2,3-dioxygenase-like lactoylglutathione lyase family enzyme
MKGIDSMPISGINHFNIRAAPIILETLLDFYVTVLGLRIGFRPPFKSRGYWLYAGDNDVLHLTEAMPGEKNDFTGVGKIDHIAFSCFNPEDFEQRLKNIGIAYDIEEVPLTKQHQIFLTDPVGNGVELNFSS